MLEGAGISLTTLLFKFPDGMLKFVGRGEAGSSARRSTGSRQSAHSTVDPHPASAQYQLFLGALLLLRLADGV